MTNLNETTVKLGKKLLKQTKALFSKYMQVNSFVNLDPGRNYITYNYSIFDFLIYNRGVKSGVKNTRVQKFINLVKENKYYFDLAVIIVNQNGVILDGRHRFEQAKACGLPVLFVITDDPRLNIANGFELACNIAIFNAHNPKWESTDNYNTAVLFKRSLAVHMDSILGKLSTNYPKVDSTVFKSTQFIHLLDFKHLKTTLRSRTLEEFDRTELLNVAVTKEFNEALKSVLSIISYFLVYGAPVRTSKVIESLAMLIKTDPHFCITQCAKNVKKMGFRPAIKNENKKDLDNLFSEYGKLIDGNVQYRKFR